MPSYTTGSQVVPAQNCTHGKSYPFFTPKSYTILAGVISYAVLTICSINRSTKIMYGKRLGFAIHNLGRSTLSTGTHANSYHQVFISYKSNVINDVYLKHWK